MSEPAGKQSPLSHPTPPPQRDTPGQWELPPSEPPHPAEMMPGWAPRHREKRPLEPVAPFALAFAVVAFFFQMEIFGPLAFACGLVSLIRLAASERKLAGWSLAFSGLLIGGCSMLILWVLREQWNMLIRGLGF
jgi:hypothetical protein